MRGQDTTTRDKWKIARVKHGYGEIIDALVVPLEIARRGDLSAAAKLALALAGVAEKPSITVFDLRSRLGMGTEEANQALLELGAKGFGSATTCVEFFLKDEGES